MIHHGRNARSILGAGCVRPKAFSLLVVLFCLHLVPKVAAQTRIADIFGRSLNTNGVTLVDWDGYLANPLITIYLLPPTNATFPGSATLTANGPRLYFSEPSTVSPTGPSTGVSFTNATNRVPVGISIFPDRDSSNEDYTLTLVYQGSGKPAQTNHVPIHVVDQDLPRTNDFNVTVDFSADSTTFFADPGKRAIVEKAANDWAYFFAGMQLDPVPAATEFTYIWSNNFDGGYYVSNSFTYTGYLLYAYGTTNSGLRSGGEGSFNGKAQTSGGVTLPIQCSGGYEAETNGNYNTLGWLVLTNDNDWLVTGNLGDETNDLYSIAHHEIGHALILNEAHAGFAAARNAGAFTSADVTNYYGGPVTIDVAVDHLTGAIDPESGQGAFGYEYYGNIPRKRWVMTKLDLLCAQEVGYVLRPSSAFAALDFPSNNLAVATVGVPYSTAFVATGGIAFYDWDVVAGALPPGLQVDSFSGALTGVPKTNGVFQFTMRVRDYHTNGPAVTREEILTVMLPQPPRLAISVSGISAGNQVQLTLSGTIGQTQVVQVSSNLLNWTPLATNIFTNATAQLIETNAPGYFARFYRTLLVP